MRAIELVRNFEEEARILDERRLNLGLDLLEGSLLFSSHIIYYFHHFTNISYYQVSLFFYLAFIAFLDHLLTHRKKKAFFHLAFLVCKALGGELQ